MKLPILASIYRKEMLDLLRDRRTVISMVIVPVLFIPVLMGVGTRLMSRAEQKSEAEAQTMAIGVRVQTPAVLGAVSGIGMKVVEKQDLRAAVQNKEIAAAIVEKTGADGRMELDVYHDSSNPASSVAGERVRAALAELRERQIREALTKAGVPESVLSPFGMNRVNVAPERKMAGMIWGSMLGYLLLLMMFSGGMYPVIDMTAGEKERKTLEPFLATPVPRGTIVLGKTLAAITAIFITAMLTLGSMVFSLKGNSFGSKSGEFARAMGTIPLDGATLGLLVLTVLPLAVLAASVMIAIAIFARSFKEGQSYLTPLMMIVIFPAFTSMIPGLQLSPLMCLIPIFNASQVIRSILLGEITPLLFTLTLAANLVYVALAMFVARKRFENESVLFRS